MRVSKSALASQTGMAYLRTGMAYWHAISADRWIMDLSIHGIYG
ncbi:MAG: hypothetical protein ACLQDF_06465 [Desulfomonilia bacterium]